jgi:predicted alpha/beta-hydrolase family hydrolase
VRAQPFETPHGRANAYVDAVAGARGAIVLGHGAGGSVTAPDLTTVRDVAVANGFTAVLVEQPYRVAGRRSPAPAAQLDAAWTSVVTQLRDGELRGLPLVVGGRSSGARVACRTAAAIGAVGVLCLAFPLQPAARAGKPPSPSRLPELDAVPVPVLVVQGLGDPFGMPPAGHDREVVPLRGDHRLASDRPGLSAAVGDWLSRF